MFKLNKFLGLIIIMIILLIAVPSCFAHENDTAMAIDEDNENPIEISDDENILKGSNDYYFDVNAENDGNGSIDNPYKNLTMERIKANSNIHLADGEYKLDNSTNINQVNFIGNSANSTVLKSNGFAFTVLNSLTLTNLTIEGAKITGNLNATNTVFSNGHGTSTDSYNNTFGGAIYCPSGSSIVNIKNCTFIDNYAEYGGAIYMYGGSLNVTDSMFINNHAYNFGGSIACEYGTRLSISKSKFFNSSSMADAGGSIYMKSSSLTINNVTVFNSSATFGGAITTLNTYVSSYYLTAQNCNAVWDGGAIYHMYGDYTSTYGVFTNNSAKNGGAMFIDNSTSLTLMNNWFINNSASLCAGAFYSICNTIKQGLTKNHFINNTAIFNDEYILTELNLTIANGNYTMYRNEESDIFELPEYYSLRDYNMVTLPKDQQTSGNCWAFTAIAVLESAILKAGGQSLDLSEENMKNVIARFSDYGWTIQTNDGGYDNMPWGYLASWLGPVLEVDDPFDDMGTLSPVLDSIMHVQNILLLKRDNFTDNDAIKKAIMKYGAVGTSMAFYSQYYNKNTYYCYGSNTPNHAVTIVGWDDNYSLNNFRYKPQANGAWIVKNSWNTDWGDNGYFYVSYYDTKFAQPGGYNSYTVILNDTIKYDKNYQYDIAGMTDYYYFNDDEVWYKNAFNVDTDEYLAAVSTYFEKTVDWVSSVYVNGELKAIKNGTSNSGYYTIDLGKLIPLKSNDKLEVVFKVNASNPISFPISEKVSLNKLAYKPNVSFFSLDGINWVDLYNYRDSYGTHTYASATACIKAFTILNEINTQTSLSIANGYSGLVNITARVIDEYGNLLNNGNVTFNINGEDFVVDVINGMAGLNYAVTQASNVIFATFNAVGYTSSSDSLNVTGKMTPVITINDVGDVNVGDVITISAFADNGEEVTIAVNDEILENGNSYTIENGGLYVITATTNENDQYYAGFNSTSFYVRGIASLSVSAKSITYGDELAVKVTSNDDFAYRINVTVGNQSKLLRLKDGKGTVKFSGLNAGTYTVVALYKGDDDYLPGWATASVKVKKAVPDLAVAAGAVAYGEDLVVKVTSVDDLAYRVNVTVGGQSKLLRLKDGAGTVKFSGLNPGVYTVVALYKGDSNFLETSANAHAQVKEVPNLSVVADAVAYGDDLVVRVISVDDLDYRVNVTVGGQSKLLRLKDGAGTVKFSGLAVGTYTVVALYKGDSNYSPATATASVEVTNPVPVVNVCGNGAAYGEDLVVNVTLNEDINSDVLVTLGDVSQVISLVGGKGSVVYTGLDAGNHAVSISFDGDSNYAPITVDSYVNVAKAVSDLSVIANSVAYGENLVVKVTSNDDFAYRINVTVGGQSKLLRLKDGVGTLKFSGLAAGTYTVVAVYKGDNNYLPVTADVSVEVM